MKRGGNRAGTGKPLEHWYTKGTEQECWNWHGGRSKGYGVCRVNNIVTKAHIAVYKKAKGEYPWYLELDHKCRNTLCVNPNHLEPVTALVNMQRGISFAVTNAAKTHCSMGHEYTEENTYRYPNGRRDCKTCNHISGALYRAKKKAQLEEMKARGLE